MLRKKQREQTVDDAYNKYIYDDENLPNWFMHEEKRHWQAIKSVTKEEVVVMKAQFREIDNRPIKKVAEAKAHKKRTAMKKLEKVQHKADSISDQTGILERSKRKMIDQLYKKAIPKRPKKEYMVAKKGVQVKPGKGKVLVDWRMNKDARSQGIGRIGKGGAKKAKGMKAKGNGAKRKRSAMKQGRIYGGPEGSMVPPCIKISSPFLLHNLDIKGLFGNPKINGTVGGSPQNRIPCPIWVAMEYCRLDRYSLCRGSCGLESDPVSGAQNTAAWKREEP